MGQNDFAPTPAALYGLVMLMAAIAYYLLQIAILRIPGGNPVLASALGPDWKGKLSPVAYVAAIPLGFVSRWIACGLYVLVAVVWLIPDRRIERALANHGQNESRVP